MPAGLFAGIAEIDLRIPAVAASGAAVPIQVIAGHFASPANAGIGIR